MRRLLVTVAVVLPLLGAGLFGPASARPASSPTDGLSYGTATIVTGVDPAGPIPTWTTTLSGQIAAGGHVFSGTATGTADEGNPNGYAVIFAGTSATGSISASCLGPDATDTPPLAGYGAPNGPAPAGVLVENCSVVIDGVDAGLQLVLALAPTADPTTYTGVFSAAPALESLPTVPVISFGYSHAFVFTGPNGNGIDFALTGQLTLGGQAFHGTASGIAPDSSSSGVLNVIGVGVAPFALTGTSATGAVNATCSGAFVGTGTAYLPGVGLGLSVLGCDGSVNGGTPGHATLVSVYRLTSDETHFGEFWTYDGAFAGL